MRYLQILVDQRYSDDDTIETISAIHSMDDTRESVSIEIRMFRVGNPGLPEGIMMHDQFQNRACVIVYASESPCEGPDDNMVP